MLEVLVAMVLIAATALGMPQRFEYSDGGVHVVIQSSSRTMTVKKGARRYAYDLARVFPIRSHNVAFFTGESGGCGALHPMQYIAPYAAIAYVWAEKGCRPAAAFIDVDSGSVAETADVDHRWDHRLDVVPDRFTLLQRVRVRSVERVTLAQVTKPWPFLLLKGTDTHGNPRLYAVETPQYELDGNPDPGMNVLPTPGSTVDVGTLWDPIGIHLYPDRLVLRFDAEDDARYSSFQAAESPQAEHAFKRNEWYLLMDRYAGAAQFASALHALSMALTNETGTDQYAADRQYYSACTKLIVDVRARRISAKAASLAWPAGCQPLP
jgi:hypothetical protein